MLTGLYQAKAWLIDLDGTLYRSAPVRMALLAELMLGHWPAIPSLHVFRREHEMLRTESARAETNCYQLQLERTASRLSKSTDEVARTVEEWMLRRPSKWIRLFRRRRLLRIIESFRALGGRTAVVSDYPATRKLAALGASQLFDVVIANGENGAPRCMKPAPDGLLKAAQQLRLQPADCWVIGDRLAVDAVAARQAGMSFLHVRRVH